MAKSRITIGLVLLLILLGLDFALTPALAAPDELRWSRENIPAEGEAGGWVLANGSDVKHLTMAGDGTLYACVEGLPYSLYKSTDGGDSWSQTGNVTGAIVALAIAGDGTIIYYATATNVYKSTDAGSSFVPLAANPALAASANIEITSIDIGRLGDSSLIVVGTRDSDTGEFGGVYVLDEGQPFSGWLDTSVGDYDVYAVAFSPGFASDEQIVAVVTDETESFVTTKIGSAGWSQTIGDARLDKDNSGASVAVSISADIAFPDDYSSDVTAGSYVQLVAIDAGGDDGDVYKVYGMAAQGSVAIDLDIGSGYGLGNVDVTSLAVTGSAVSARLLAGVAGSSQVYYSINSGNSWERSLKRPTGQSETYVLMAPDFGSSGKAYAATSGPESAFSKTQDGGVSWNQLGLIDTEISAIVGLAVSPNYGEDSTLFMLTWGGQFSLWRSLNGGARWQRVFSSALDSVSSIDLVELSPQYGSDSQGVFLAGSGDGSPALWKSADNGQSFIRRSTPLPVDQWAVVNDTSLFLAGYDGSNGRLYYTSNSGLSYSTGVVAGNQSLSSIALSPNYEQDGVVLVGNSNGWIYWSNDDGTSFEPLPSYAISPPLTGSMSVAFDPEFSSNRTVYAASDTPDGGIYRFVIGTSTSWQSIDSNLPDGGMIGNLAVSADGTLYAANFQQVDTVGGKGGMERCLEPASSSGATFETVTRGLDGGATLYGLWLRGNQLWSIDTTNNRLMTYIDSLGRPVVLASPQNQAPGIGTITNGTISDVSLFWQPLDGATSYQWQLDDDNNFSSVPAGFEGNTGSSSVGLPALAPATTYYWRVRAVGPVLSLWSARWSFATSLGGEIVAPSLMSPQAGAGGVPIRPVFQWGVVAGADGYELVVSSHYDFANPVILKVGDYALPGNAWQADVSLNYATTYYWKVRAINASTNSAWSATSAFTTELEPEPPIVVEPPPTPVITIVPPEIPDITLPPVETPDIALPPVEIPDIVQPDITLPPLEIPDITLPPVEVTVELPSPPPQSTPATPDWVFFMVGFMGLVIILVLVVRRR